VRMSSKARQILLILLVVLSLLLPYQYHVKKDMTDFGVCYQGGERIVKGEVLYQTSDGHLQYKYSPVSAVFFSVLTLFPYDVAKLLWYFLELYLLFLSLALSYDILPAQYKKKGCVVAFSFFILLKFIGREIELGQVNILMYFLLLMMIKALLEKKDVQGGLLWGFSIFFKPYALVFLPYFFLRKRLKLLASGMATLVIGFLLPVFFYGLEKAIFVLKEWQRTLSLSTRPLIVQYDNASVYAFFLKNLPANKEKLAWGLSFSLIFAAGLFLLGIIFKGKKKGLLKPEVLECSYLLVLIPFLSPMGWYYNYLYSILAVVFLVNLIDRFPAALKYILIADFVFIGASLSEVLGKKGYHFYTQHALVFVGYLIILFYLVYSRFKLEPA
jgi:hypothetical protein